MKISSKRIATLGILISLALITYILESLFPPLIVPGAKMGLSNIFSMLAVIVLSPISGIILVVLRTILGSLIVGNLSQLMFSLSAGIIAIIVIILLYQFLFPEISIVAISVVGGVVHNLVQNAIYAIVTQNIKVFAYSPYLSLIGCISGLIVGLIIYIIIKKVPTTLIDKVN